eukprot:365874-Chlamydomonas_euryale.AAC.19
MLGADDAASSWQPLHCKLRGTKDDEPSKESTGAAEEAQPHWEESATFTDVLEEETLPCSSIRARARLNRTGSHSSVTG